MLSLFFLLSGNVPKIPEKLFRMSLILVSKTFSGLFRSESPLVLQFVENIWYGFTICGKLTQQSSAALHVILKNIAEDLIDLFFRHPEKNIIHSRILRMMGVIFHNSTFERNPKYHFGKCKDKIVIVVSKNRQGPLVGHLWQFTGIIPLEFKKERLDKI